MKMSLLQNVKDDQLSARKAKDYVRAALLTTLYSEAAMIGKNSGNRESTDVEVMGIVKKFITNTKELLTHSPDNAQAKLELEILMKYLPAQLTDEELTEVITTLYKEHSGNMGLVMKSLKESHNGKYDGKKASEIFRGIKV